MTSKTLEVNRRPNVDSIDVETFWTLNWACAFGRHSVLALTFTFFYLKKSLGMIEYRVSGHVCQCFSQRQRLLSPLQYSVPVGQSRHHSSPTLTFSLVRPLAKKNAKTCQGFKSTEKMTQLFQYTSMSTHIFPHTGVEQSTVRCAEYRSTPLFYNFNVKMATCEIIVFDVIRLSDWILLLSVKMHEILVKSLPQ